MKARNVEFEIEGTVDRANQAVGKFLQTVTEKLKETPLITGHEATCCEPECGSDSFKK